MAQNSIPSTAKRLAPNRSLGIAMAAALLGSAAAPAQDVVYTVDTTITSPDPTGNPLQSDTVLGTITTDGTIGALGSANIVSYNLNLIDNLNGANDFDLTTKNSTVVEDLGSALSASATGLSFNYSGSGEFLIQGTANGAFSGYNYFCFSTGLYACAKGETVSPQYFYSDAAVLTGSSAPIGVQPLGPPTTTPTSAPEIDPGSVGSALSLLLGGLALIRGRNRK